MFFIYTVVLIIDYTTTMSSFDDNKSYVIMMDGVEKWVERDWIGYCGSPNHSDEDENPLDPSSPIGIEFHPKKCNNKSGLAIAEMICEDLDTIGDDYSDEIVDFVRFLEELQNFAYDHPDATFVTKMLVR